MTGFHFSFILGKSQSSARVEIHGGAGKESWKERSSVLPRSGRLCGNATSASCEFSCSCENGLGGSAVPFNQMLLVIQKPGTCSLGLHTPSTRLYFMQPHQHHNE